MTHLFPPIEPYATGRLRVSDLHEIHYEECGNPQGKAAVFLHGGPGVGIVPPYRQFFDPKFWRVVLPDQRGARKSTPHAELRENTTWELIEDLEKLRKHLGIDKWVVMGGSWGSFLALAYAIMHPESVRGVIIRGVMLGRKSETDWLFKEGMNWVYPDAWEQFISLVPAEKRGDMVKAYYDMVSSKDPEIAKKAVMAWSKWEGAANQLVPPEGEDMFDDLHRAISIAIVGSEVTVSPAEKTRLARALWGTYAAHVRNMIAGVNQPFVKRLQIEGIGFRAEQTGKQLKLSIGFSHPVLVDVPQGITVAVEKNIITISGADKDMVGEFAATVRAKKKPEPYKGKGIRYEGEVVREKQGKKAATAAAG